MPGCALDSVSISAFRASLRIARGSRRIVQSTSRRRSELHPISTVHRPPVRPRPSALALPNPWGGNQSWPRLSRELWNSRAARGEESRAGSRVESSGEATAQDGPKVGLLDRVKDLTKRYGSAALVVYLGYSAIDFSLTFLLIYAIGADHVREAEDWALEKLHWRRVETGSTGGTLATEVHQENNRIGGIKADHSMLWTTAVLAYAIHKTLFLPLRVGLTAATTPRIVRALRSWGWNVGRPVSAATQASAFGALGLASIAQGSAKAAPPRTG